MWFKLSLDTSCFTIPYNSWILNLWDSAKPCVAWACLSHQAQKCHMSRTSSVRAQVRIPLKMKGTMLNSETIVVCKSFICVFCCFAVHWYSKHFPSRTLASNKIVPFLRPTNAKRTLTHYDTLLKELSPKQKLKSRSRWRSKENILCPNGKRLWENSNPMSFYVVLYPTSRLGHLLRHGIGPCGWFRWFPRRPSMRAGKTSKSQISPVQVGTPQENPSCFTDFQWPDGWFPLLNSTVSSGTSSFAAAVSPDRFQRSKTRSQKRASEAPTTAWDFGKSAGPARQKNHRWHGELAKVRPS